ncbi:hypothetical protein KY289_007707 [Solanum tuberosum]|nr:hypothetical protein KY289_007707 [Solanum tuberosum]KAH0714532.1 hypothetical protein KY284_007437 [Solanum tuberosum]
MLRFHIQLLPKSRFNFMMPYKSGAELVRAQGFIQIFRENFDSIVAAFKPLPLHLCFSISMFRA